MGLGSVQASCSFEDLTKPYLLSAFCCKLQSGQKYSYASLAHPHCLDLCACCLQLCLSLFACCRGVADACVVTLQLVQGHLEAAHTVTTCPNQNMQIHDCGNPVLPGTHASSQGADAPSYVPSKLD